MRTDQPSFSEYEHPAESAAWKQAEERKLAAQQQLTYTERFRIMMRLMRINAMLKNAVITHRELPR